MKRNKGMSIIELMISTSIFSSVIMLSLSILNSVQNYNSFITVKETIHVQAKITMMKILEEVQDVRSDQFLDRITESSSNVVDNNDIKYFKSGKIFYMRYVPYDPIKNITIKEGASTREIEIGKIVIINENNKFTVLANNVVKDDTWQGLNGTRDAPLCKGLSFSLDNRELSISLSMLKQDIKKIPYIAYYQSKIILGAKP